MERIWQLLVLFLAFAVSAIAVLVPLAGAQSVPDLKRTRSLTTPVWARPLRGVQPYYVERNYGMSGGLSCDLSIYTANSRALDGKATLRPGDLTATVCVVRRGAANDDHDHPKGRDE